MCWMLGIQIKKKKQVGPCPQSMLPPVQTETREQAVAWQGNSSVLQPRPSTWFGWVHLQNRTVETAARCPAISFASPSSKAPVEQKQCQGGSGSVPQTQLLSPDCQEGKKKKKKSNSHDMKRGLQWPTHLSSALLLMRPTRAEEAAVAGLQDGWLQALTLQERDK